MYFCINTLSPHKFWASMKATRFLQYPTDVNSFHSRAMFLSPEASPSFCGVELVPLVYGCGKPGRAFLIPMPCFGRGGKAWAGVSTHLWAYQPQKITDLLKVQLGGFRVNELQTQQRYCMYLWYLSQLPVKIPHQGTSWISNYAHLLAEHPFCLKGFVAISLQRSAYLISVSAGWP